MEYSLDIDGRKMVLSEKSKSEIIFTCSAKPGFFYFGTRLWFYDNKNNLILDFKYSAAIFKSKNELIFQQLPLPVSIQFSNKKLCMLVGSDKLFIKTKFIGAMYPQFYKNDIFCGKPVLKRISPGLMGRFDRSETYEFSFSDQTDPLNIYCILYFMINKGIGQI